MHMNIYREIDLGIKKKKSFSFLDFVRLFVAGLFHTQATNPRYMTPFYIIRQHGDKKMKWSLWILLLQVTI